MCLPMALELIGPNGFYGARIAALARDAAEMLSEQLEYRDLLVQMTLRDLRLRYKQAVMGFGWAILMPLVNTVVFSVIFTRVAPIETGVPYPLFAFASTSELLTVTRSVTPTARSRTNTSQVPLKSFGTKLDPNELNAT